MNADPPLNDLQTYAIIGAAMTVHRELGCGFLEQVYQNAFEIELRSLSIPYLREVKIQVNYKGKNAGDYVTDFICYNSIVIELKAQQRLTGIEESQLLNYLKATGFERGLHLNFGGKSLEYGRKILTHSRK